MLYRNPTNRPVFIDRYFICRKNPPVMVVGQPMKGFATEREGEAFLAGMLRQDWQRSQEFAIVIGTEILP